VGPDRAKGQRRGTPIEGQHINGHSDDAGQHGEQVVAKVSMLDQARLRAGRPEHGREQSLIGTFRAQALYRRKQRRRPAEIGP